MDNNLLDIHTHKAEKDSSGIAITNYRLFENAPFIENCYYSAGIHPWKVDAPDIRQQLDFLTDQVESVKNKQIVAIGEVGLDRLAVPTMGHQLPIFGIQIDLAKRNDLPVILHCVKAMDLLLAAKKAIAPTKPWIWHGFRGKPEQAKQLLSKGIYLSFGEFYSEEALRLVPDDRLFLETDESRCSLEELLHRAAAVRGTETEALRETLRNNIRNVFFD